MHYSTIFDKLVMDLSSRERKELLEKIRNSVNVSVEPLVSEAEDERIVSLDQAYVKLNILQKFFLFFKSLFTGKKRDVLVEEYLLKKLSLKISRKNPNLISFLRKQLLEGFIDEIDKLQVHLVPLIGIFSKALDRARGPFYAFLISLELDAVNERLVEETNPYNFYSEDRFRDISEVRGEMEHRFKLIIDSINQDDRTRIYRSVLALYHFFKLMIFRFDAIIPRKNDTITGRTILNFPAVKRDIMQLCDLLKSTIYPPPSNAIKAIYLFSAEGAPDDPADTGEEGIDEFIRAADAALGTIRQFNRSVPMTDIVRCLNKDYSYKPQVIKGGEDWFVLFKAYWEQKIDDRFKEFYKEKKVKILVENALSFLDAEAFLELKFYREEDEYDGFVRYPLSIAFIRNFIERIYNPRLGKSLKILLLSGNFYKKQNRSEFTDAYNGLSNLPEEIALLDSELSPSAEIGAKIKQIEYEVKQNKLRNKQISSLAKEIDEHAKSIIEASIVHLNTLSNVVDGVLFGQIGGKFDTISNLKSIGGKDNAELLSSLKSSIGTFVKAYEFVRDFYQLESRSKSRERY